MDLALSIAARTVELSVATPMAYTTRYVGDFTPIIVVGTIICTSAVVRNEVRPRFMTLTAATTASLTLCGILADTGIHADQGWILLNP